MTNGNAVDSRTLVETRHDYLIVSHQNAIRMQKSDMNRCTPFIRLVGKAVYGASSVFGLMLSGCLPRFSTQPEMVTFTTVAGGKGAGYGGDNGSATDAGLDSPWGLAIGSDQCLYLADQNNHAIRMVDQNGIIHTVAGTGSPGFSGDGRPATKALLKSPTHVFITPDGVIYLSDTDNNRVRKFTRRGLITTVAGNGRQGFSGDGGPAKRASLNKPAGICVDSAGNLYIADQGNDRVRRVDGTGLITTVAGNGKEAPDGFRTARRTVDGVHNGDSGPAIEAFLEAPSCVCTDRQGRLYIANADRIRRVDKAGLISTVCGGGSTANYHGAPATDADLGVVADIALSAQDELYFVDAMYKLVGRLGQQGQIDVVASNPPGTGNWMFPPPRGESMSVPFVFPAGLAISARGDLFISDTQACRVIKFKMK